MPPNLTQPVYDIPSPDNGYVMPGGHHMQISLRVVPYTGPGTYDHEQGPSGSALVDSTMYFTNPPASASLTVHADGSGSMTASNLGGRAYVGAPTAGSLSLSMQWTCVANYE